MPRDWTDFWSWVDEQRQCRKMSWYRLEELAGVGNAVLSERARNNRKPTIDNMEGIARALDVSMREVFARAGYIEPLEENVIDDSLAGLLRLAESLTPAERREVLDYLIWHFRRDLLQRDQAQGRQATGESREAKGPA